MDLKGLGIVAGVILGEVRMDKRQTKNKLQACKQWATYSRTVDKDVVYYSAQKSTTLPGVMLLHGRKNYILECICHRMQDRR